MKKIVAIIAASAAIGISAGAASAATTWASSVVSTSPGFYAPPQGQLPDRVDPNNALGAPDGKFYSPGLGGSITLGFDKQFELSGKVVEVTFNRKSNHDEAIELYASADNVTYNFLGVVTNAQAVNTFNFAGGPFSYLKAVDVSNTYFASTTSFDGFDIDAIGVSPVPVPAAGFLLLGGLGALGALRRKKASA